ncbi:MAG: hypothetical protein R3E66_21390 [bacterium]
MTEINFEKGSYAPQRAATRILEELRTRARADVSEREAAEWTGLPLEVVRPGLLLLSVRGGEVFASQGRLLVHIDMNSPLAGLALPVWVNRLRDRFDRVLSALWPLAGTGFAAMAFAGFAALFVGNTFLVFPGVGPAVQTITVLFVLGTFLFVAPAIALALVVMLPILAVFALASGELLFALAVIPLAVILGTGLPALWALGNGVMARAWSFVRRLYNFGRDGDVIQEQELFEQLARARRGRLVLADLCVLYGCDMHTARRRMTRNLLDHGGRASIDGEGRLWFEFPSLADGVPMPPAPVWFRETEPRLVFDDASRRLDGILVVVLLGALLPYLWLMRLKYEPTRMAAEYVWRHWELDARLGAVAAVFFCAFVPALLVARRIVLFWRQRRWPQRRLWLETLRTAANGQVRVRRDEIDVAGVRSLRGAVLAETQDVLEVSFPEFRQMDFAHDAWERPRGATQFR